MTSSARLLMYVLCRHSYGTDVTFIYLFSFIQP